MLPDFHRKDRLDDEEALKVKKTPPSKSTFFRRMRNHLLIEGQAQRCVTLTPALRSQCWMAAWWRSPTTPSSRRTSTSRRRWTRADAGRASILSIPRRTQDLSKWDGYLPGQRCQIHLMESAMVIMVDVSYSEVWRGDKRSVRWAWWRKRQRRILRRQLVSSWRYIVDICGHEGRSIFAFMKVYRYVWSHHDGRSIFVVMKVDQYVLSYHEVKSMFLFGGKS